MPTGEHSTRFWSERDLGSPSEDALALAAAGYPKDAGLHAVEEACAGKCTVLLGSPGAGKSTELKKFEKGLKKDGIVAQFLDLRGCPDTEALRRALLGGAASAALTQPSYLLLDSLDESPMSAVVLANVLPELLGQLPAWVRIVIACRSAAWNTGLESELANALDELKVFLLAPLTRNQIKTIAQSSGLDPDVFWKDVRDVGATALTASPLMVRLLVAEFSGLTQGERPSVSQVDLYQKSTMRLVDDRNPLADSEFTVFDKHSTAAFLGALALLTGTRAFWLNAGEPPDSSLSIDQVSGVSIQCAHPAGTRELALDRRLVKATLESALFEEVAPGRVWFLQQSLAEYLAAQYLVASSALPEQVEPLLRGRKGLVAPQVQALAAWLVSLDPDSYQQLVADDPMAFVLSGTELGESYRKSLVETVFKLARNSELPRGMEAAGLRNLDFEGIDPILIGVITDKRAGYESRYLAFRVARQNRRTSVAPELVSVALDSSEFPYIRNSAAHAALDLDANVAADIARGLFVPKIDDPDDQLMGVGLKAALEAGWHMPHLLQNLTAPKNTDLFGSYKMALQFDLPQAISKQGAHLVETADWALAKCVHETADDDEDGSEFNTVLDGILLRVASVTSVRPDGDLVERLDSIVRHRIDRHHHLFLERRQRAGSDLSPGAKESLYRSAARVLAGLPSRHAYGAYVVVRDLGADADLEWLVGQSVAAASKAESRAWAFLARAAFQPDNRRHIDVCLGVDEGTVIFDEVFKAWRQPVMLGSERAEQLKELHAPPREEDEDHQPLGLSRLRELLQQTLADPGPEAFATLCAQLQIDPDETYVQTSLEVDIRELHGWKLLDPSAQDKALDQALRHLHTKGVDPIREAGKSTYTHGSIAAVRALFLLEASGRAAEQLTSSDWAYWRPAILHFPPSGEDEERLVGLMKHAYTLDTAGFLIDAEREVRQSEHGHVELRRIAAVLDGEAIDWFARLATSLSMTCAVSRQAMGPLLQLDPSRARDVLESVLTQGDPERSVAVCLGCIGPGLHLVWGTIMQWLRKHGDLAQNFLQEAAQWEQLDPTPLSETDVAGLWELCLDLFPQIDDPVVRGVHTVSPRESVAHFRDQLLPALSARGTDDAVNQLERLAASYPDHGAWIKRLRAEAERRVASREWVPSELAMAVAMLTDPQKRLVSWAGDLLDVVLKDLRRIQAILTMSANPEESLLWNHAPGCAACRPKSEDDLNDYVARRIREGLDEVLVNREVEVSRHGTKGMGDRPDLLVSAQTAGPRPQQVHVAIEGKGSWNPTVKHAVNTQLIPKYVDPVPRTAGLLLAYWFGRDHVDKASSRLYDVTGGDALAFNDIVNLQADTASTPERPIRGFVLDASLSRWHKA